MLTGAGGRRRPLRLRLSRTTWAEQPATWRDARPALIDAALARAGARPTGNWYVAGPSEAVRPGHPHGTTVAGAEIVLWRGAGGTPLAGPGACPHLEAPLACGTVRDGTLTCPWHGLRLDGTPTAGWAPYPAYDDGLLVWVRLDAIGGEPPADRPPRVARPAPHAALAAVHTAHGTCEPADIVANRLDPWHGAWFHPYAFTDLTVTSTPDGVHGDAFTVEVSYRVTSRLVVPVTAVFTAPGPRTVVMRITAGEGTGSVVETHATPLAPGADGRPRTAVTEAVVATSDRPGFPTARRLAPLLRPLMRSASARLWRDDLAYAERRYARRTAAGTQRDAVGETG